MDRIRSYARSLRHNPTDAERLLWRRIRMWQVDGLKFRRQQPIGRYIVDFVCLEKRVVVEIDGGQHAEQNDYDSKRDAWLRDQGFSVLRFWNHDVLQKIESVADKIYQTVKSTPSLSPSPQGGCVVMRKCPTSVIPSAARDLVFSATYEDEISRLHLEMTVATQSEGGRKRKRTATYDGYNHS